MTYFTVGDLAELTALANQMRDEQYCRCCKVVPVRANVVLCDGCHAELTAADSLETQQSQWCQMCQIAPVQLGDDYCGLCLEQIIGELQRQDEEYRIGRGLY